MNQLHVGLNRKIEVPKGALLIADEYDGKAKHFDPLKDSIDPLREMDHKKARQLVDIIYAPFPQGENTLTVRNGKRALFKLLEKKPHRLSELTLQDSKDPGEIEAIATVQDILSSPVVKNVLCGYPYFRFNANATTFARINRAELGDFDALIIGLFLMAHYKGVVVVQDFGFYGRLMHTDLIRQDRLIAGVKTLSELPDKLRDAVLQIPEKVGRGALYEDAEELAKYAGLQPDRLREDNPYNRFIWDAVE